MFLSGLPRCGEGLGFWGGSCACSLKGSLQGFRSLGRGLGQQGEVLPKSQGLKLVLKSIVLPDPMLDSLIEPSGGRK